MARLELSDSTTGVRRSASASAMCVAHRRAVSARPCQQQTHEVICWDSAAHDHTAVRSGNNRIYVTLLHDQPTLMMYSTAVLMGQLQCHVFRYPQRISTVRHAWRLSRWTSEGGGTLARRVRKCATTRLAIWSLATYARPRRRNTRRLATRSGTCSNGTCAKDSAGFRATHWLLPHILGDVHACLGVAGLLVCQLMLLHTLVILLWLL